MVCTWAAPPTCMSSGLRAYQGVNAHIQGFACEQHATTDSKSAKVQTHSAKTGHFQRLSSNGSVLWRPHHLEARPRRHQPGGMTSSKPPTRRRHAARGLRMAQTPTGHRSGERRGHGGHGRSAREQRQGGAITHHPARGLRQSTTQLAQQQTHQAPPVQNSPSTPALAACPVQNSPRTPALTACAV